MDEVYEIRYVENPEEPLWKAIGGGLRDYNNQQAGDGAGKLLCFAVYAPDQSILGGVIGETHWNWLYINLMFLKEELRGQGYGHRLLTLAEEEGRRRGATDAYLDTFSFQAPEFYKQHGYHVYGVLEDFPPGHQRYFFTKRL